MIGSLYFDGTFIFSNFGGGFNSRSGKYLYFLPADCETRILEGFNRLRFRGLSRGSNSKTCLKRTAIFVLKDCGVGKNKNIIFSNDVITCIGRRYKIAQSRYRKNSVKYLKILNNLGLEMAELNFFTISDPSKFRKD